MFKEQIQKMLTAKEEQRKNLMDAIVNGETAEERSTANDALTALDEEIANLRSMLAACDEPAQGGAQQGNAPQGRMRVLEASAQGGAQRSEGNATMEYRRAFQNYIANGNREELRAAAGNSTGADNVGSIIPENLLNQIIEKLETVGTIYNLVTHTSYPVGQTIPREATKPVATWVGVSTSNSGEGNGSAVGKGTVLDTAIVFANFKLRCEVAMTEEVANMTLSAFETLFVKNVSIAMMRAIENAIVDGTGVGMPTGILKTSVREGQNIEVAAADKLTYALLCEAEGAIPAEYEANAKWCMSKKTFMSFVAMTDDNGQPIARVNYGVNGKPERTLLGREVVLYTPQSGSALGNYADSVTEETMFAFIFDFAHYVLNNNYNLGIQHKIDWDNEDHRTKAVAAYDGKVIDNGSLVTLTKLGA